jgi:hypothetical protein
LSKSPFNIFIIKDAQLGVTPVQHVLAAKSVQIRASSGKCIIPVPAVFSRGQNLKEDKAEPRQPSKAIMAKTAVKGKWPANASTTVVDVQGATASASWKKLKKVLQKAIAFCNFQFNNLIIRGG